MLRNIKLQSSVMSVDSAMDLVNEMTSHEREELSFGSVFNGQSHDQATIVIIPIVGDATVIRPIASQ